MTALKRPQEQAAYLRSRRIRHWINSKRVVVPRSAVEQGEQERRQIEPNFAAVEGRAFASSRSLIRMLMSSSADSTDTIAPHSALSFAWPLLASLESAALLLWDGLSREDLTTEQQSKFYAYALTVHAMLVQCSTELVGARLVRSAMVERLLTRYRQSLARLCEQPDLSLTAKLEAQRLCGAIDRLELPSQWATISSAENGDG